MVMVMVMVMMVLIVMVMVMVMMVLIVMVAVMVHSGPTGGKTGAPGCFIFGLFRTIRARGDPCPVRAARYLGTVL